MDRILIGEKRPWKMDDDMKLPAKNNGVESDHTLPGHPMHARAGHGSHGMGTGPTAMTWMILKNDSLSR